MLLRRLGMEDLTLPITATTLAVDGAITVAADDPARALRAVMTRQPVLCHDTMTGIPDPETVSLSMGDETFTGCGGDPAALLTGRTWQIDAIDGAAPPKDAPATLTFHTDGRASGTGGCNRWFAAYSLTGEGMTFQQAGATMMACPPDVMQAERRFHDALARVAGFDIDRTGALILHGGDAAPILRARPISAAP
jgi:heat shock protein HslJ